MSKIWGLTIRHCDGLNRNPDSLRSVFLYLWTCVSIYTNLFYRNSVFICEMNKFGLNMAIIYVIENKSPDWLRKVSVWMLRTFSVLAWIFVRAPQSKSVHYVLIGDSKLASLRVTESVFLCLCAHCGLLVPTHGWSLPLTQSPRIGSGSHHLERG